MGSRTPIRKNTFEGSQAVESNSKSTDKRSSQDRGQNWSSAQSSDCDFQVACSRAQYRAAFRLTYDAYLRQGLTMPNPLRMRILPHQLLQTSWVFTATRAWKVVATLSLLEDGRLGLPMDELYAAEINRIRAQGQRLAELTCLAHRARVDNTMRNRGKAVTTLGTFMKHVASFAVQRGIDSFVMCVHPRHVSFYHRHYGFRVCGPDRCCPWANSQPATPLRLDQRRIRAALRVFEALDGDHQPGGLQANEIRPVSPAVTNHFLNQLAEASPLQSGEHNRMAA